MEKDLEFFDAWVKSQKEFLGTWSKSQKELLTNWAESTKKLQESFVNLGAAQEGPAKEATNLFNSLFTTMTNSTKVLSEEVEKIQETWKTTFEKQMETSREILKNFSQFFKQTSDKK
ncbi:MAG: hypothetical protein ACHQYP_04410 [Nitrospiria bacterium]